MRSHSIRMAAARAPESSRNGEPAEKADRQNCGGEHDRRDDAKLKIAQAAWSRRFRSAVHEATPRAGTAAEPAFARRERGDGLRQMNGTEIRPIARQKHEFAVGGLPEQEIGQPDFAAGADHQVGIGNARGVEQRRRRVGGDRRRDRDARPQPPRRPFASPARSRRATIVEGDDQIERRIVRGQRFGFIEQGADVGLQVRRDRR